MRVIKSRIPSKDR